MINIAELLKDVAKHTELYSPICGHCKLSGILYDDGIRVIAHDVPFRFDKYGRFCSADDAECLLFPGEDCRTWEGWKLPVKPKFKAEDWLVYKDGSTFCDGLKTVQVQTVEEGMYIFTHATNGSHHSIDSECRLWEVSDAKDGDVLISKSGNPFIFLEDRVYAGYHNIIAYCGINTMGNFTESRRKECWTYGTSLKPATKEQRDLLFTKMKEAGYTWDSEKKELKKIQSHYDIANFQPFDKVLVRDRNDEPWRIAFYGYYSEEAHYSHFVGTCWSKQCIPFDGNEHLLGTTDMPSEEYINW